MRPIKILQVIGIVTVCTLCIGLVGWAQPGKTRSFPQFPGEKPNVFHLPRDWFPGHGLNDGDLGINWAEIDLSEEQQEQIQQKFREFQVNIAGIRQKLQFIQKDLHTEMRKDPLDQAKVDNLWAEITDLKRQINEAQANHFLAIKSILTSEQLEKLQKKGKTAQELRALKAELQEMLLASDEPDAETLKQLQAKIAEKEIALQKERFEQLTQKQTSLTPEQREKISKWQNMRKWMKTPRQR